jgi:glycosyltransferase involved in cell wall biosynthesis
MKIGVIIPSRLAPRPGGRELREFGPELWLDGALASVVNQQGYNVNDWEIFVAVDPNALVPIHVYDHATIVRGKSAGRARAINEAADVALLDGCEALAFLDDDDRWHRRKTEIMLPHLERALFLSCSQRLVSENSLDLGVNNDYPGPSGWIVAASLWKKLGGYNVAFKWTIDREYLGRVNELKVPWIHFRERGLLGKRRAGQSEHAEIIETDVPECLVSKTTNSQGIHATILAGGVAEEEAAFELAERVKSVRSVLHAKLASYRPKLVPPDPLPRYDEVFEEGVRALDADAGEPLVAETGEQVFDLTVRKSREGNE